MIHKTPKRKVDRYAIGNDNEYPAHFYDYNITLACVKCRITKRVNHIIKDDLNICPQCRNKMQNFGCKYRLPKKSDDKAWKKLEGKQ